jgi:hypothetical protein
LISGEQEGTLVDMIGDPGGPDHTKCVTRSKESESKRPSWWSESELRSIINPPDPDNPGQTLVPGNHNKRGQLVWFRVLGDASASEYQLVREGTTEEAKKLSEVSSVVVFHSIPHGQYLVHTSWSRLPR